MRSKMLIPFDDKQYVDADKRQLCSKVPVIISFIRTNTWNIRVFQMPVGNSANKSWNQCIIASFCSHFNVHGMLKSERSLVLPRKRNQNKNHREMSRSNNWQRVIDSWSLIAPIRSSVRRRTEYGKITITSGRRNLHSHTLTPLLIFDRRPPPWYKFFSLLSLPPPLKSKMAVIIFVRKLLSTRSPKSRLLCRLQLSWYHLFYISLLSQTRT